jgi:integrase
MAKRSGSKSGFSRKADAEAEKTRVLNELNDGRWVRPVPKTFHDFLTEWFREHAEQYCAPKTVERYRQLAAYVLPSIGPLQLRQISPFILERLYNQLRNCGGKRKGKEDSTGPKASRLSARTVRHVAGLVHVALGTAVRWKLLQINPADACQLPRVEKKEARALDTDHVEWYLDASRGTYMYPILVLGAATGCRRGELLALTWRDVNSEADPPTLSVSKSLEQTKNGLRVKQPKNGRPRSIPLPAFSVEALVAHRHEQLKNRKLFGADYCVDLDLVFAQPDGNYLKPDSVTAKACLIAKKAGLRSIGMHSLRHSHGSQLLAEGVPLPTVSKRLGHSSVAVTAAIYSHPFTRDEIAAAEIWDKRMRKAIAAAEATKQ